MKKKRDLFYSPNMIMNAVLWVLHVYLFLNIITILGFLAPLNFPRTHESPQSTYSKLCFNIGGASLHYWQ